jgi:hypothetical protein
LCEETTADDFHRRNSQKPSDELVRNFKDNFPQLNVGSIGTTASAEGSTSLADALEDSVTSRYGQPTFRCPSRRNDFALQSPSLPIDNTPNPMANSAFRSIHPQPQDIKDADPTPKGSNEPWAFGSSGLTPSMMDPNSHAFHMFANTGYMPTPGGNTTLYHPAAGDLHTPSFPMGLGTPLSMPTSEGALHAGHQAAAFQHFHAQLPQHVPQHSFQNMNPYHMHQQPSFPPQQFTHHASFEHLEGPIGESPVDDMGMDMNLHQHQHSPQMLFHSQALQNTMQPPPIHPTGEK